MSSPSDHIAAKSFHAFVGGAGGMGGVPPVLWSPVLSTIYPALTAPVITHRKQLSIIEAP